MFFFLWYKCSMYSYKLGLNAIVSDIYIYCVHGIFQDKKKRLNLGDIGILYNFKKRGEGGYRRAVIGKVNFFGSVIGRGTHACNHIVLIYQEFWTNQSWHKASLYIFFSIHTWVSHLHMIFILLDLYDCMSQLLVLYQHIIMFCIFHTERYFLVEKLFNKKFDV